ncbi:hypothetical protein ABL78_8562 [Leptomonas seymouri]|uniref:Uncharacterized protein n=1 Tax=Leptomonas seymouri TaxID=5684 RepID=A0A0N1IGY6_LEPSE|nr:hypothetical protein ABL78_8562 [Leptomonas seymouri]|eukprot:KPI82428.1 hypothetical protein ABL78_8562 [Leptomonas seymouri]
MFALHRHVRNTKAAAGSADDFFAGRRAYASANAAPKRADMAMYHRFVYPNNAMTSVRAAMNGFKDQPKLYMLARRW